MDSTQLRERLTLIDNRFNTAKVQRDQKESELATLDVELHRIQGDYRTVQELLADAEQREAEQLQAQADRIAPSRGPEVTATSSVSADPEEGQVVDDNTRPYKHKLDPVDETGIPNDAKWSNNSKGGRSGR